MSFFSMALPLAMEILLAAAPTTPALDATEGLEPPLASLRLVLSAGGDEPGYPVAVRLSNGTSYCAASEKEVLRIPGNATRLQRITVEGWGSLWIPANPGEVTTLEEHPCCGIGLSDPASRDDLFAVCPRAPDGDRCPPGAELGDDGCICPPGAEAVRPAPASDPVCGDAGRCVPMPLLRWVPEPDAPSGLVLETSSDERLPEPSGTEGAPYRPVARGPGNLVQVRLSREEGPGSDEFPVATLGLLAGASYTLHVGAEGISSVSVDEPPPAASSGPPQPR